MHMKWGIALPVVIFALGGILLFHYRAGNDAAAEEQVTHATVPESRPSKPDATTPKDAHAHVAESYFLPITGGKPRQRAPMDPFFRVPRTRNGMPLAGDQFVAESVEEQRWLDRHGYPNSQQWAAYSRASDLELEQAAAHGDSVAAVFLASHQLARGDPAASGRLMTAGMNGSSFAIHELSAYLTGARNGNPELGYALSRVE